MSDLLARLNPQQLAAVTLPSQHGLILAGAGSGKTRVLTTRLAWLISTGQVGAQGVLAVTFTNKASKEMQARLSALLPINTRGMWIGTFHGLCNRLLRAHHREAALPALFQILDSGDQLSAIKRLLKLLNVDEERFPPRELAHFINAHKEQGLRAAQAEASDDFTRRRIALYAEYEGQCQREGVVDFAELLLRSYELLSRNEALRRHYQARFRHILVDEFQDTNVLQYRWLKLLADNGSPEGAKIFAVGDDDQSIYGFRGAEVGNMRDFEREFGVREVIRLEQNYRSHGNILDAANAIIRHNARRLGKNLWTEAGAGEPIRVYGGLRFFERQEVKHAMSYLRLLGNPDDDTAFLRVVNFPARGIGARSLENLQAAAHQSNSSLYNAAASLTGKPGQAVGAFIRLIEDLRRETAGLPLPEVVEHILEKSGLLAHYRSEKDGQDRLENLDELINAATNFLGEFSEGVLDENGRPLAEAQSPLAAFGSGVTPSALAFTESGSRVLAAFLAHASLEAGEHQAGEGQEALQLMTVHSAKGLEFDVVFISGLEQGLFPHENSMLEREGLEEERRLMYVAITRARQRLYLSHAQTRMLHGQTRYCLPSAFLEELPQELLRRINRAPVYVAEPATRGAYGSYAAATTQPRSGPAEAGGFRVGQSVAHARFGQGVIVAAEGRGSDARVQVNFADSGIKWLALEYAKLSAA